MIDAERLAHLRSKVVAVPAESTHARSQQKDDTGPESFYSRLRKRSRRLTPEEEVILARRAQRGDLEAKLGEEDGQWVHQSSACR